MVTSDKDRAAVELTLRTPGWNVIVGIARARIEAAKVAALMNTDETKFLEMYRKAHAAQAALYEFLQEVEQPNQEPE